MVITDLARDKFAGSPAARKNITPPITSIKTATGGTSLNKIKSRIFSINSKKWQRVQGHPSVPQGTNPSVGHWA